MTTTMIKRDGQLSEICLGNLGAQVKLLGYDGVEKNPVGGAVISTGNYNLIVDCDSGLHANFGNGVLLVRDSGISFGVALAVSQTVTFSNPAPIIFTATATRITGPFEAATRSSRPFFQSSATNGDTNVSAMPSGSNNIAKFEAYNGSAPNSATGIASLEANGTEIRLTAGFSTGSGLPLQIYVGGVKAVDIATTGAVTLPVAPLTLTGGQLAFPAVQNPSGNANTLDDYEESTWVPVLVSTGATTYTLQDGTYTKIGRKVTVCCTLIVNVKAGGASVASVGGLPFTVGSVPGTAAVNFWASSATAYVFIAGLMAPGTTQVDFYGVTAAATGSSLTTFFQNGARIQFSGTYFV